MEQETRNTKREKVNIGRNILPSALTLHQVRKFIHLTTTWWLLRINFPLKCLS